jgi:hypothetical protein
MVDVPRPVSEYISASVICLSFVHAERVEGLRDLYCELSLALPILMIAISDHSEQTHNASPAEGKSSIRTSHQRGTL